MGRPSRITRVGDRSLSIWKRIFSNALHVQQGHCFGPFSALHDSLLLTSSLLKKTMVVGKTMAGRSHSSSKRSGRFFFASLWVCKISTRTKSRPKQTKQIRWPLLARGTTAADIEYRLLFNNHRCCFQLFSHLLLSCYKAKLPRDLVPPPHEFWIQIHPENPSTFKPASGAIKTRKIRPPKNNRKSTPESIKNELCEKLFFAIHVTGKPGFKSPRRPNFDSIINRKSGVKTSPKRN